jgi:hypothetical protein
MVIEAAAAPPDVEELKMLVVPPETVTVTEEPALPFIIMISRNAPDATGSNAVVPLLLTDSRVEIAVEFERTAGPVVSEALRPLIWFSETLRTFDEPLPVKS